MKHYELEVEHYYKSKFMTRHRLQKNKPVVILGHSRNADIRLLGEDVNEIHAYLEYQDGVWSVIDAGSQHGSWIQKKPITNELIKATTIVNIGAHQLKLTPKILENEVFSAASFLRDSSKGGKIFHQIIVRKDGVVVRSHLVEANSSFTYFFEGKEHIFQAPKNDEISENKLGPFIIIQRLVKSENVSVGFKDFIVNLKSTEMRTPIVAVITLLFMVSGLILALPQRPKEELNEIKPDNKYTRMIFDAELIKKKRAEAKEMRKTIAASAPKSQEQVKNVLTTPVKSKGATPKVVSSLKMEGLNALLGKIAKRANQKGPTIIGFGKSADSPGTGSATAMASVGSLQGISTGTPGNGGQTYKVGGVGTLGKGGGNNRALAGLSGLATGAAGAGTVGILDEETEIDGGLDKEVIAKVISNYLGEVRYCYERQLSAEPELYGKVQIKFTIDAQGAVDSQRIGTTTLNSAMVEGCILRRLARWKFPKPKGGTHVLVTYPFMFKSTN
jgi:outer membrane biosynthesis protein TonB/pSer/pThr/pTyr-binding forkhead associated (FHA) protein